MCMVQLEEVFQSDRSCHILKGLHWDIRQDYWLLLGFVCGGKRGNKHAVFNELPIKFITKYFDKLSKMLIDGTLSYKVIRLKIN